MRTTVDLPDALFRAAKTKAVQEGVKLKELIAGYLEAGLRGDIVLPAVPQQQRRDLPIARRADGSVTPYRSNAELQALLDEEDLDKN